MSRDDETDLEIEIDPDGGVQDVSDLPTRVLIKMPERGSDFDDFEKTQIISPEVAMRLRRAARSRK